MLLAKTPAPAQAARSSAPTWTAWRPRVGNKTFDSGARCFLARYPDRRPSPGLPLEQRLASTRPHLQPVLNFLMLHGHLQPGYDYLLGPQADRDLAGKRRRSPLGPDLKRFLAGAQTLDYSERARTGMASQIAVRMLIQTGRVLGKLTDGDFAAFGQAITEREERSWAASSSITTARSTRPVRHTDHRRAREPVRTVHAGPVELGTPSGRRHR